MKLSKNNRTGFTLIELIVAITVMTVIFGAVATLASAMSNADSQTKNMSEQQAKVRYTTLMIKEVVRGGCHIIPVSTPVMGFCVWNDSDMDAVPEGGELSYISFGSNLSSSDVFSVDADDRYVLKLSSSCDIKLVEFPDETQTFTITDICDGDAYSWCVSYSDMRSITLMSDCSSVNLAIDEELETVAIVYSVLENGETRTYDLFAGRMCSIDHALDDSGELDSGGDDDI